MRILLYATFISFILSYPVLLNILEVEFGVKFWKSDLLQPPLETGQHDHHLTIDVEEWEHGEQNVLVGVVHHLRGTVQEVKKISLKKVEGVNLCENSNVVMQKLWGYI